MSAAINRAFLLKTRTSPTETVDSGEAYFWLEGTAVKYKDDTQTVKTLATGVSPEDVQDIVGAFVSAGSSKVSVTYNDIANTLVIDIVEANIVHQNLSGAGTNTHAQIDSHISSTANPHAVTKAQVGLGNVDNTSDANKPVSTATQTALNLKYDASNPNGYETPAQLNARDTNNRNRANHTGSQVASTISDFAATVISSVLTGFSVGANAAIVATDTILQAFAKAQGQITALINRNINTGTGLQGGGNLSADRTLSLTDTGAVAGTYGATTLHQVTVDAQGRITAISNGPALALGDQFQQFLDNTVFTTTSTTNVAAASFTTVSKPTGTYRIGLSWDWTISIATSDAIFGLYIDGALQGTEWREEASETVTQNILRTSFKYITFGTVATHTIELRVRNEAAGVTTTVNNVLVEVWRMS